LEVVDGAGDYLSSSFIQILPCIYGVLGGHEEAGVCFVQGDGVAPTTGEAWDGEQWVAGVELRAKGGAVVDD